MNFLAGVLEALPSPRMTVKIDTDGRDVHNTDLKYLRPLIRSIIPRLYNLLLRISHLCPAVIRTEGPESLSFEHHDFPDRLSTAEYINAPTLQTLIVSLNNAWWTL